MSHDIGLITVVMLGVLFALAGCDHTATNSGAPNDPIPSQTAASETSPPVTAAVETPAVVKPPAVEETAAEAFEPPFLGRENPFAPPDTARRPSRDRAGEVSANLALMGFVNVGEPKVVLMIDNLVESLAVGETKGGIQVIAIEPPRVTLQRGRRRWVESLEQVQDGPPQ